MDIPKGAKLLIVTASANHDPREFENPDQLDLYRETAADHLTFGYGAHQCMGKNIARLEMRIFLEELSRRLPHMELSKQTFEYLPNTSFRGPKSLLVEWDATLNPEASDSSVLAQANDYPIGPPAKSDIRRRLRVAEALVGEGNVLHLRLEDPSGAPLPRWTPGSHIELFSGSFARKYSLCGTTDEVGQFRIAILNEAEGRGGSMYFHRTVNTGDILHAAGPRNHFQLDEDAEEYLLIAGGIGITPVLAKADRLKALGKRYQLHYAGQSREGMAFAARIARDHGSVATLYAKDEDQRMELSETVARFGRTGRIYACGPERLLQALDGLTEDGPEGWLSFESFTSVDTSLDPAKEHGFTVHLQDSSRDVQVRADQTVLDALTQAGIDVPCDCREGLCGSCEVEVAEGGVDHRDNVLTRSERAAGNRMMTCCSRAQGDRLVLRL